nr:unnamed protein product [Callosobruchus analis]
MTDVEVIFNKNVDCTILRQCGTSDFDDLPLSYFVPKKRQRYRSKRMGTRIWAPLALFSLFIDDDVVNLIVKYTNLYATLHIRQDDIASSEIRCFIGVLLLSGYNVFPRRSMYWENSDDAGDKLVYSVISRDRFNFIAQNLHLNDNSNLEGTDKFSKMRPLFSILKKNIISEEYCHLGLGASVVLQFADVIQDQNKKTPFHIFCDNFVASLPLLAGLTKRGIKCTGRIGFQIAHLEKPQSKKRSVQLELIGHNISIQETGGSAASVIRTHPYIVGASDMRRKGYISYIEN